MPKNFALTLYSAGVSVAAARGCRQRIDIVRTGNALEVRLGDLQPQAP